jgi:hypothetical protein
MKKFRNDYPPIPNVPNILVGDKIIRKILHDLESIKNSKKNKLKRCELLIFYIVSTLRKEQHDHLYQTTSVWALMNILKIDPKVNRIVMLHAGVPSILHNFMRSKLLTKSTRQYTSELCYYLW